jgi:hypothetical protein
LITYYYYHPTDPFLFVQKTTLLSGALTGATLALTEPNPRHDRVVRGAITGGAIATAAAVVRNLTD